MKIAHINDLTMNYFDNGNTDKPVLVFIHGLGENLHSWAFQIEYFSRNYHIVVMDLRGHGLTSDGMNGITIENMASDIIGLLDYLNIEKASFIGLSLGGMICQELTKHHQDRMEKLVLCNTAAYTVNNTDYPLESRLKMITQTPMDILAGYLTKSCLSNGFTKEVYNQTVKMFSANRVVPYLSATAAAFSVDYREILEDIKVPTLIIVGEYDLVTPVAASKFLHQQIKNSELAIIPNASHLTKIESPIIFNQYVENFLDK